MGFLQTSSAQPAQNSDKEQKLNASFLSTGVHVNVEANDVEELPISVERQSSRHAKKRPAKPVHLGGKKKKGSSLSETTEAIRASLRCQGQGLISPLTICPNQESLLWVVIGSQLTKQLPCSTFTQIWIISLIARS